MPDTILSMEGEKRDQNEKAGKTIEQGGDHVEPSDKESDIVICNLQNWLKRLSEVCDVRKADGLKKVAAPCQESKPVKIQWAPKMLWDKYESSNYFKTKRFCLSPISYNKFVYSEAGEDNQRLAGLFIRNYGLEQSVCKKMFENINKFRQGYLTNKFSYYFDRKTDEELSRMLILDGCALLFYIDCFMSDDLHKLELEDQQLDEASHDIFKLENQVPYEALELLMECSTLRKPSLLHDFVKLQSVVPGIDTRKIGRGYKPAHLLDLMWMRMRGVVPIRKRNFIRQFSIASTRNARSTSRVPTKNQERKKGHIKWSPSHSVKNLKAAWILLKPGTALTQISFRPGIVSGEFQLPRLTIDESTQVKLLNLIAYEMCPDFENDLEVTSYICFLHSFVVNVEDVADLRSAGVLINNLSSNVRVLDERVLELFSEITSGLDPNPAVYRAIQKEIQKHFDRKGRTTIATWFAEAAEVYFRTPWSTITVLAATFAIILSVVQTYFAIFPRKSP